MVSFFVPPVVSGTTVFPEVMGTPATSVPAAIGESMSVSLPSGIQTGEALFVFIFTGGTPASASFAATGWTQAFSVTSGGFRLTCMRKDATGAEGSSFTMTWTGSTNDVACIAYRVANAMLSTNPEVAILATTASASSTNPPLLSPSWGDTKTLWFIAALLSSTRTLTWPAPYVPGVGDASNIAADPKFYMRGRQAEAATEDPGAVTWTTDTTASSATIGIRPG